jgi:hypothetical protein
MLTCSIWLEKFDGGFFLYIYKHASKGRLGFV